MRFSFIFLLCIMLLGCGTQVPLQGQEREDYLKSIKGYGEYWVKPGITKERWQQDWVACGGMPNGSYANDAPQRSSTATIRAASERISNLLGACMQSKGYEYRYTDP